MGDGHNLPKGRKEMDRHRELTDGREQIIDRQTIAGKNGRKTEFWNDDKFSGISSNSGIFRTQCEI